MKSVTAFYKRSIFILCPYCKEVNEFRNEDPIATINIVGIGKVLNCFSCSQSFKIVSEEVL